MPGNLPTTYPDPFGPLPAVRVGGKHEKIRASTATGLQFRRLPVRPGNRSGSTHSGPVDNPPREVEVHKKLEELYCQAVHVSDGTAHSNGKTSVVWSTSHEAHPMALEATLVVGRKQHTAGPTLAPPSTRSSAVYRRLKRRLGRTLRGLHCKRRLVTPRKSPPHKLLRVKGSPSGPQEFRASLQGPDCSGCNGQHNCGLLHKQTGRYEIRLSLCPSLETPVLVSPQGNKSKGSSHPRSVECDSRQTIQTQSADPNRVVPLSAGVQSFVLKMVSATGRPFCNPVEHKLPKFVSPVPDPTAWAVDAMSLSWENLDEYAFPPVSLLNQVISKVVDLGCRRMILIAPGRPNMPWFWDLVNLSIQIPFRLPFNEI